MVAASAGQLLLFKADSFVAGSLEQRVVHNSTVWLRYSCMLLSCCNPVGSHVCEGKLTLYSIGNVFRSAHARPQHSSTYFIDRHLRYDYQVGLAAGEGVARL